MTERPKATGTWLGQLVGKAAPEAPYPGQATVATGRQAAVAAEARICRRLCHASHSARPGHDALGAAEAVPWGRNAFDQPGLAITLRGPREAVAATAGLAMAGLRVAGFLPAGGLGDVLDLLRDAAGRHVPLLLHAACRAAPRQAAVAASGHEGYHAAAESGAFLALAEHPGHAIDLALVARRAAEHALAPCIIAQDELETACAPRDVRMPEPELIRQFLGAPETMIDCPTPAQRLLFGEQRRLLPRLFDLDRPVALGGIQGAVDFAAGALGQEAFFDRRLAECLAEAMEQWRRQTGRSVPWLTEHGMKDAQVALVTQGSCVDVARAAADVLRSSKGVRIGVIGVTWLRPFPEQALRQALQHVRTAAVLERVPPPPGGESPLLKDVRRVTGSAGLRLISVTGGVGGCPLTTGKLVALGEYLTGPARVQDRIQLDTERLDLNSDFPKRDMVLQAVRGLHPDEQFPTLPMATSPDTRPTGARTLVLLDSETDGPDETLTALARALPGEHVRSRARVPEPGFRIVRITSSGEPFADPGDATPADVTLIAAWNPPAYVNPLTEAVEGGVVLLAAGEASIEALGSLVPGSWRRTMAERSLRVFRIARNGDDWVTAVQAALEGHDECLDAIPWSSLPAPAGAAGEREVPMAMRRMPHIEHSFDNLPRFWGEVVQPRVEGERPGVFPDPRSTLGAMPSYTATCHDRTPSRETLPKFDAAACTGCGWCWTACPDSAIGCAALGTQRILDAAADRTGRSGTQADALRRAHRQWAAHLDGRLSKAGAGTLTDEALRESGAWLVEKLGVKDDERPVYQDLLDAVRECSRRLPLAVTDRLFHEPHRAKQGSGELLALAVNPRACQGCGVCEAVCPAQAICMVPQTEFGVTAWRQAWDAWENLPDTSGETIARVSNDLEAGPLAALLMSRHALLTVVGGDGAEPGSGERLALRQITAVVEHHMQQQAARQARRLAELAGRLRERIRENLASALTLDDMSALDEVLSKTPERRAEFAAIVSRLDALGQTTRVDTELLHRMAQLAHDIERRHWRLTEGPTGLGRARFSIVITSAAIRDWALRYPYNPFGVPVTVDLDGVGEARGIQEAFLDEVTNQYRLIRRAELALDAPADRILQEQVLSSLTWRDLPAEELAVCPPVLVIGDTRTPGTAENMTRLLSAGLPIRAVLLTGMEELDRPGDSAWVAMTAQTEFVLSTSIAHPSHLFEGVTAALAGRSPALIQVYAPSPRRHGFLPREVLTQARRAVDGRVHLLFRFDPAAEGAFGTRICLEGNPAPEETWVGGEDGTPRTPVHWAKGERRFAGYLSPVSEEAAAGTSVALVDWLGMDVTRRASCTPFLSDADGRKTAIHPALARATACRLGAWRTLQELAGVATPFTEKVQARAREETAEAHRREVEALKSGFEAEMAAWRAQQHDVQSTKLRERLLQLYRHGSAGVALPGNGSDST